MRFVSDEMRNQVVDRFPLTSFMFDERWRTQKDWSPRLTNRLTADNNNLDELSGPLLVVDQVIKPANFHQPAPEQMHPVDQLHFLPNLMNNNIGRIFSTINISVATMGQDQRHRTISRGMPYFTGSFYMPPLVRLHGKLSSLLFFKRWKETLANVLPDTLMTAIAPYGAIVCYEKSSSFNALLHEQAKRLCWCAQEEIYHLSKCLREKLVYLSEATPELRRICETLQPPCHASGQCAEGDRYCGRPMIRNPKPDQDYNPERFV